MKKAELFFIPSPGVGHLVPSVELAKLMVARHQLLSITLLVMKPPFMASNITNCVASISASSISERIRLIDLPTHNEQTTPGNSLDSFIESQKPHVQETVSQLMTTLSESSNDSPPRLAGFVVGMFTTTMIDVANEFGVDSYVFFPSSAASLGLMLYMQALHDEQNVDTTEFKGSDAEFKLPSFVNPVPARVLPFPVFNKDWHPFYYGNARRIRGSKGIIVNTFSELESHAVNSFSDGKTPPLYPVGPIVNLQASGHDVGLSASQKNDEIMAWLDDQAPLSVVFLCFGSMGSLSEDQVKEIAYALDHSRYRFLWSLRQPPPKGIKGLPTDYTNFEEVLPDGFLNRTAEVGRVIGWAPQVAILANRAIGGFVSHCGWNSILESIWFGVPIATWPLFAEQQLNAFEMIVELGLAVEIKMDYRKENESILNASDIERGIRCVMEYDSDIREKVKDMRKQSIKALIDGGSSYSSLGRLIANVMDNFK